MARSPIILVTVQAPARAVDAGLAQRKNRRYLEAVERHGATAVAIDETADHTTRASAFERMEGLLLSGGADIDPARFGQAVDGAEDTEPGRDELEAEAFAAAARRGLPLLGVCRGLQAINVFSGGGLLQHVPGHAGASYGRGPAATHPLDVDATSRLAGWLGTHDGLEVNSYHHQGIRVGDLAPGLRASAWAASAAGPLVEGLESEGDRFVAGIQCHPERTESTPAAFERLFAAFVAAAGSGQRGGQAVAPGPEARAASRR